MWCQRGFVAFVCIKAAATHVLPLAGKSTLLQILAGKRLITSQGADVRIKGRDVFRDSPPGVTFLGTEWSVDFAIISSQLELMHIC